MVDRAHLIENRLKGVCIMCVRLAHFKAAVRLRASVVYMLLRAPSGPDLRSCCGSGLCGGEAYARGATDYNDALSF
jgi:hypothetical protein